MAKKIYLGTSDFPTIVNSNGLLADKTLYIKEVIDSSDTVMLITRPRRWGKTLSQSMLQAFLSSEVHGIKTAGLFDDLAIAKVDDGRYIREHQGQHPVIFISFKDVKELTFDGCVNNLRFLIQRLYREHSYLLSSTKLLDFELNIFKKYIECEKDVQVITDAIKDLSELMYKHFNKKVYILIDEYDTPLNSAYLRGYIEELTELMRNILSLALKDNINLEKGILTGILRISKDSMLSGLNNLEVYTILDKKYNQYFGFTDDELDLLFKEQGLERDEPTVKSWYDGYNFAGCNIYNPWSILSSLKRDGELEAYWVNTSNNKIIEKLLLEFRDDVQFDMVKLMNNQSIEITLDKHVSFDLMSLNTSPFWGLMLFSGYLTTDKIVFTNGLIYDCLLRIPNYEIKILLELFYRQWFVRCLRNNYKSFLNNLVHGNVEAFTLQLNTYLIEAISIRDTGYTAEKFYHGIVLGLLASLRDSHVVLSNYESGNGYADAIIIPLANSKLDLGIVMEFKHAKDGNDLEKLAQKALVQIEDTRYTVAFQNHPQVKRVLKLGLAFNQKQVIVTHNIS